MAIHCDICGTKIADVQAAIAADWIPTYWVSYHTDGGEGEYETGNPVCPNCAASCLDFPDGDPVLREGAAVPLPAGRVLGFERTD